MNYMFASCGKLLSLNLSNFDTSKVTDMNNMFSGCSALFSLVLSNFDTSNVTNMYGMFYGCSQLSSLNLSNFDNSNVTNMQNMFYNCLELSSLSLSNFYTSKVTEMSYMFYNCEKLSSLDLSNFDTSSVTNMNNMFKGCSKLSSLNLSNFDTSNVENMKDMFSDCSNLEYINLKNFKEKNGLKTSGIFENVPDNVVVCLHENHNRIFPELMKKNCYTLDCSDNWKINQKKIINKTDVCFDTNSQHILYKYEYQGLYYEYCVNGTVINNLTIGNCDQCDTEICTSCSKTPSVANNSCTQCKNGYYEIENDNNSNENKKCYKDPIGYYLDTNETISIYKKCYYSCEECETNGNNNTHNCIKCNKDYPIELKFNNNSNCYQNCTYYYYFDNNNYYHCTDDNNCPNDYPSLYGLECKKISEIKNEIEDLIQNLGDEKNKEEEIKAYDNILKNMEEILTSNNYDTTKIDNGKDEIIEIEKIKVVLTTTENQKNNINSDMTTIDLGDCETSLRQVYNLTNGEKIYIKMIENEQEGMKIPKVEYDIYSKLNGENLTKLNISSCKNDQISLSIPVDDIGNIDKLNSSSGYYNDICYTATTESGTDITLSDRKNEFPSVAVCQDDCDFVGYNYTSKKAKCSCKVKESSSTFADMNINKNKLLENFKDIKNIINFKLLVCVENLFSKIGLLENVGFYIFIVFIILHIISLFVFYIKQLDLLISKIRDIIFSLNNLNLINGDKKEKKEEEKNKEIIEIKPKEKNEKENEDFNNIYNEINNDNEKISPKKKAKKVIKKRRYKILKKDIGNSINVKDDIINIIKKSLNKDIIIVNKNKRNNDKSIFSEKNTKTANITKITKIMEYSEEELNDFSYDLALQNDKRTYWQFYFSLIKTKHEFIYSFFYNKDYNAKIIKIDLFFFGFASNYTVNGMFFNDETMHNVYENKGLFDVSYQLPIIVYSSLISMALGALVQRLALSKDAIIDFKQSKETKEVNEIGAKLIKKLKIKFVFYFIVSFIFLIFFSYYISMFDAVYKNTQFLLLEDTLMGVGLSFVYPFVIYLFPGLFRIPALAAPQKDKKCLYDLSKIFTIL